MNILEIGMTDKLGGMEMYFHNYYYYFSDSFRFDFVDMFEGFFFSDEYKAHGSRIHTVPHCKKHFIRCFFELKKLIKKGGYDLVHINMLSAANIIPVLAAKAGGAKIAVHSHNSDVPKGNLRKLLNIINRPVIGSIADIRFACSEVAGKWLFGDMPFDIVPNAIDLKKYSFNEQIRNEIREKYGLGDAFVLGNVGRFSEQKNHRFLVKMFEKYHKYNKKSKLFLVGRGELESQIKADCSALGIIDDVIFAGESSEAEKLYQAMDIFTFPSLFEGFGMVAVEAQAAGLPCISSTNVCAETALTENVRFLETTEENIGEWIEAIEYFKCKPTDRSNVVFSRDFEASNSVKNFEDLFMKMKG